MTALARRLALCAALATAAVLLFAGSAMAAEGPAWKITSVFSRGILKLTAVDTGGDTDGSPITISDTLPAGFLVEEVTGIDTYSKATSFEIPCGPT